MPPLYVPRIVPPERYAWQELGTQASGIGSLILGLDADKKDRARQSMLDQRQQDQWQAGMDFDREGRADARSDVAFQREVQGFTPVDRVAEGAADVNSSIANIRGTMSPVPAYLGGAQGMPGIGAKIRELQPTYAGGTIRYDPTRDLGRSQQLADEARLREQTLTDEERNFGRDKDLLLAPRWQAPDAPVQWERIIDGRTGEYVEINPITGQTRRPGVTAPADKTGSGSGQGRFAREVPSWDMVAEWVDETYDDLSPFERFQMIEDIIAGNEPPPPPPWTVGLPPMQANPPLSRMTPEEIAATRGSGAPFEPRAPSPWTPARDRTPSASPDLPPPQRGGAPPMSTDIGDSINGRSTSLLDEAAEHYRLVRPSGAGASAADINAERARAMAEDGASEEEIEYMLSRIR
jgi:hypothetical protein